IDPEGIDRILAAQIESRGAPVQEQLIEVYTRVLRVRVSPADDDDPEVPENQRVRRAVTVALRRVLQCLQDEKLEIDPLFEAVQGVHAASHHYPQQLIEHQDVLLGTM